MHYPLSCISLIPAFSVVADLPYPLLWMMFAPISVLLCLPALGLAAPVTIVPGGNGNELSLSSGSNIPTLDAKLSYRRQEHAVEWVLIYAYSIRSATHILCSGTSHAQVETRSTSLL